MNPRKGLVLDANILMRAVLGRRVRGKRVPDTLTPLTPLLLFMAPSLSNTVYVSAHVFVKRKMHFSGNYIWLVFIRMRKRSRIIERFPLAFQSAHV
jgi:hypothetical protein